MEQNKKIFNIDESSTDSVNDSAVKRLLKQSTITGLQIGRILFLNICEMIEGKKQLYTYDEYLDMISLLSSSHDLDSINDFIFFQRLTTYAVNELNEMIIRNKLSLKGLKYINSELQLFKLNNKHNLDYNEIYNTIDDIKTNIQYINSYGLFFDAMKLLLKDNRLKEDYRISRQSQKVLQAVDIHNRNIDRWINPLKKKTKPKDIEKFIIHEAYTDINDMPSTQPITELSSYLKNTFDPQKNSIDNITTSDIAKYINFHFNKI